MSEPLNDSKPLAVGSRSPYDEMMEARLARIETRLEHVEHGVGELRIDMRELRDDMREIRRDHRSDFRLLFGAIIAVALGLASLMAKGFHWL